VVTATALASMAASLLVGLGCNMPFGMSPGMGLNAYLVYSQVLGAEVSLEAALAGCMAAAGLVALLAVVRALALILAVVPDSIKLATVVGMGLLLTFIGLQSAAIVVADPETMVTVGDLLDLKPALAIAGLALITALSYRNVRGGIMVGILATAVAYFVAAGGWPTRFVSLPHLRIGRFDWNALFVDPQGGAWSAVMAYSLVMIFDIGGAMYGLGNLAGLVRDGGIPGATTCYLAACVGTAIGAVTGACPGVGERGSTTRGLGSVWGLGGRPRSGPWLGLVWCRAGVEPSLQIATRGSPLGRVWTRGLGNAPVDLTAALHLAPADAQTRALVPLPPTHPYRHDAGHHRGGERCGHQGGRPDGPCGGDGGWLLRRVRLPGALPAVHPPGAARACGSGRRCDVPSLCYAASDAFALQHSCMCLRQKRTLCFFAHRCSRVPSCLGVARQRPPTPPWLPPPPPRSPRRPCWCWWAP
jgi:hypothetical protein